MLQYPVQSDIVMEKCMKNPNGNVGDMEARIST